MPSEDGTVGCFRGFGHYLVLRDGRAFHDIPRDRLLLVSRALTITP